MINNSKLGRNALCACGSGKKSKHCCNFQVITTTNSVLSSQVQVQISVLLDMAIDHQNAMRLAEAEQLYRQILQIDPNDPDANHLLGLLAHQVNKHEQAIELISKAIKLKPNFAEAHSNLGLAKQSMHKIDEARQHFEKAISQNPQLLVAYNNFASLLHLHDKNHQKAIFNYQKAIQLDSNSAMAYFNLANVYIDLDNYQEAYLCLKKAVNVAPDFAMAHHKLASVLHRSWRIDEAILHYDKAYKADPEISTALQDKFLMMQYSQNTHETELYDAYREYTAKYEAPFIDSWGPYQNMPNPKKRLKIAYVSADFCVHPVANFIEPVLAHHNHHDFEIYCYYNHPKQDQVSARMIQLVDHWLDCANYSTDALAEKIKEDGIDILVDLSGHTNGNRMLVFARKPAPIQISWMGYLGSTGLKSIDYRLSDCIVEPSIKDTPACIEKPWLFNNLWYVYRPCTKDPRLKDSEAMQLQATPAIENQYITFGCLNNISKVTIKAIELWSEILKLVENSQLILVTIEKNIVRERILATFAQFGIANKRIKFLNYATDNHYLLYHQIDIALDTFPYAGGTTTFDGLWMGVPFITLAGKVFRARMGITVAHHIGHPEWVAESDAQYVQKACTLASDVKQLNTLRLGLRAKMESSQLMNESSFTLNLEAAYQKMWLEYCSNNQKSTTLTQ